MKKWIKPTLALLLICAAAAGYFYGARSLPDTVYIASGEEFTYRRGLLTLKASGDDEAQTASAAGSGGSYSANLSLFDMIPLKRVMVNVVEREELVVLGSPFGVKMFTEGVIVVGFGGVRTASGEVCPAQEAGIRLGDNLLSVKGVPVGGNSELAALVKANGSRPMEVVLERGGETITVYLTPVAASDGTGYKAGMWVRDSTAGIGTATYYDPGSNIVAGLGHAIADSDTGVIMPVSQGELVDATIVGAIKGAAGAPGELKGVISGDDFADLLYNGETGIFASVYSGVEFEGVPLQIAFKQEVNEGEAQILTTVNGSEPEYYSCVIEKAYLNSSRDTQNMVIRVTDSRLLNRTGGIVQGMSGSPIVQNGRLVGAVTHVFVNDPTRGYGIFIENMLSTQAEVAEGELPNAA